MSSSSRLRWTRTGDGSGWYYTVDWVVRSAGEPFTALDLVRQGEDAELDPLLQLPQRKVEQLLNHLVRHQVVDVVPGQGTYIPDVAEAQLEVYKLADNVVRTLLGFAMHNESERAALEFSQLSIVGDQALPGVRLLNGRYERREVIGRGGMGVVYRGWDLVADCDVAIKVLHPTLDVNDRAVARFRREVSIASKMSHSQVVRFYDVVENPGEGLALVMELLPATPTNASPTPPTYAPPWTQSPNCPLERTDIGSPLSGVEHSN